ncbi:MAG: LamG domain-containing protein [Bacteroidota bacterium]
MNRHMVFAGAAVMALLFQACGDRGAEVAIPGPSAGPGAVSISLGSPPPEVVRVLAYLSRPGFATRMLELVPADSIPAAAGAFEDVPAGIWHLSVDALDLQGVIRYSGRIDVEVRPQQIAQVSLHLLPSTGGIQVSVTWGPAPPGAGLMAHYPFDGNTLDVSGNGNHGTAVGTVPVPDRHGNPAGAIWFDGVDDRVTVPSSPSLHPVNRMTITCWVRVDTMHNNYLPVLHKGGPERWVPFLANREYALYCKDNLDQLYFQLYAAGDSSGQHFVPSHGCPEDRWVFLAAVIDRVEHYMQITVNGVPLRAFDSYSGFTPNDDPLTIGAEAETSWPDHSPFRGALDDLRLHHRALSEAEIQALAGTP